MTVQGRSTNGTETSTGNVFLPKTVEVFTYDADGNLTSDGRWTNRWDAENRLVEMQPLSSIPSGAKKDLKFTYDSQGRRISKTVSNWTGSAWALSYDNRFVYDGWNLLAELNSTNGATACSYMWGLDLSGSFRSAGGVGGLLAVSPTGSGTHFVPFDGNGNVVGLIGGSSGTNSAQYEYGPFGEATRQNGTAAAANGIRFSTKSIDSESDWLYYGYRVYGPNTGSWRSRDPMEEEGGFNLYGFVKNRPLARFDAFGLITAKDTVEEIKAAAERLVASARKMEWNIAANMLQNYLDAGGDQTLPVKWLRSFQYVKDAERVNQKRFEDSLRLIAATLDCGDNDIAYLSAKWDRLISYGGRSMSTEELFYASGDSTLTSRGFFTLQKKCCIPCGRGQGSAVTVFGHVSHHWHDRYDWNPGMQVYIFGRENIPDDAMDKLRTEGSAQNFNMSADWEQTLSGYIVYCNDRKILRWSGP